VAVLLVVASASKFMTNYIVRTFQQLRFGTPLNGGAYCVTASCTIYANKIAASFSVLILCYVNSMSLPFIRAVGVCIGIVKCTCAIVLEPLQSLVLVNCSSGELFECDASIH